MSLKKILCGALAAAMIFSSSAMCSAAADESANSKLAKIECDTYGIEQSGALLDRISRLEKDFTGQNMSGNMNARIDAIYDSLYDNNAGPGILAKLNALEWNVKHEVASGGIDVRIATLEREILGTTSEEPFDNRIRSLAKASYGEEILPIAQVSIPANTLIKVETTAPASSKNMQEGDILPVRVVEDVFVDGCLVFAKGLPGEGVVTRVLRAKNIFSNGKIETDFNTLEAFDGQTAQTCTGIEAIEEMTAKSMGRGLSLIGQTFSGKNKDVEEVFIRGKNIELPAGIELYIQIKVPIVVYGVRSDGSGLLADEEIKPLTQSTVEPTTTVEPMTQPVTPPTTTQPVTPPSTTTQPVTPPSTTTQPVTPPSTTTQPVTPPPTTQPVTPPPTTQPVTPPTTDTDAGPAPPSTPPTDPNVGARPDEGKTLDGYDEEIIEIVDEE
ncbi:MAG: hypothetical protein IJS69_01340 [Selenomonadaceae bacterium]|nr:hypothetical protein [Selenomonadaceae bacterium]